MSGSASNGNGVVKSEWLSELFRNEIQSGLQIHSQELKKMVEATIKHELVALNLGNKTESVEGVAIYPLLDQDATAGAERLQQDIHKLKIRNHNLEEDKHRLEDTIAKTTLAVTQKIREAELKNKKLHKIIVESGLNQNVPIDKELELAFSQLRNRILQLVKKYCTNYDSHRHKPYDTFTPEYKDLWVMRFIATKLWDAYFDGGRRIFGFDSETDSILAKFEYNLELSERVARPDVRDWRVRTVTLSKHYDPEGGLARDAARATAVEISRKLTPFIPHGVLQKNRTEELKGVLMEICDQARQIALLFRGNDIEYVWLQRDDRYIEIDDSKVEILGSMGQQTVNEAPDQLRTVFGGVVKGGGATGRIGSEMYFLRKSEVLLGPFVV